MATDEETPAVPSLAAMRRIEAALAITENTARVTGRRRPRFGQRFVETLWAELTDYDGATGTYDWEEVRPHEVADVGGLAQPDAWEHPADARSGAAADGTGAIDPDRGSVIDPNEDMTGYGRPQRYPNNTVVLLRLTQRLLLPEDPDADPPEAPAYETRWAIVPQPEETVWASLGAWTNVDTDIHGGGPWNSYPERRYAWSRAAGYQQGDLDDSPPGGDAGEYDLSMGGTVDANYAVYHGPWNGMTLAPHFLGRPVLLRRIWRQERYYVDPPEYPNQQAFRKVQVWAIVEPPSPIGQVIKTGADYDVDSGSQEGFLCYSALQGDDGTAEGVPASTDLSACVAAALGNTGQSEQVILVNGYPDPFKKLPSNVYVDGTYKYTTSDNVKVFTCCVPGLKSGTADGVVVACPFDS